MNIRNSIQVLCAALAALTSGGCISANLGETFDSGARSAAIGDRSAAIFYVDEAVNPAIHYYVYIDGEKAAHLFPGTFKKVDVDPGKHTVMAGEWWTGKGASKGFAQIFTDPFSAENVTGQPEELSAGAKTTLGISLQPGVVVYLRISKSPTSEEFYYECDSTAETTRMCQGERYPTAIHEVANGDAERALQGFRESL